MVTNQEGRRLGQEGAELLQGTGFLSSPLPDSSSNTISWALPPGAAQVASGTQSDGRKQGGG